MTGLTGFDRVYRANGVFTALSGPRPFKCPLTDSGSSAFTPFTSGGQAQCGGGSCTDVVQATVGRHNSGHHIDVTLLQQTPPVSTTELAEVRRQLLLLPVACHQPGLRREGHIPDQVDQDVRHQPGETSEKHPTLIPLWTRSFPSTLWKKVSIRMAPKCCVTGRTTPESIKGPERTEPQQTGIRSVMEVLTESVQQEALPSGDDSWSFRGMFRLSMLSPAAPAPL
ncbi:uncharacterized protein LOC115056081 [Echeneis naucrates]|uniref:uncharacterized protein LOC115056081 n=1 Tax=Echeneis naucrates TaxID=173247 RepID=UPI00111340F6|nr:uncharacterized protein LOC115056081 [Echeneis naucrates]